MNNFYESICIDRINNLAIDAGKKILDVYNSANIDVSYKEDNSPLTEADKTSNEFICSTLEKYYPNIPILSEENSMVPFKDREKWEYYWCIDPIDGTKEFIKRNGEFTVNIALVYRSEPILGVVYAPALNELYYAKKGEGAFKNGNKLPLKINNNPKEELYVVVSKSHLSNETQLFIDKLNTKKITQVSKGSSLKLCMIAEGIADIYPRLAPTKEWDTAAADIIVRESGKKIYQFENNMPLIYNKQDLRNPWFIVK